MVITVKRKIRPVCSFTLLKRQNIHA